MHLFGLTGGIASGKSAVAARLRERDVPVIDADQLARDAVRKGSPGLAAVVATFGAGVLAEDGALDRKKLAALVFGDEPKRAALNAIVHPSTIDSWLERLVDFKPTNESEKSGWAFCLAQLTRRSGVRAIEVSEDHRERIAARLRTVHVPENWLRMVEEIVQTGGDDQSQMFGDSLPIGLRLTQSAG